MGNITAPRTPHAPKPQQHVLETDEKEAPSIIQPRVNLPAGGQGSTKIRSDTQGFTVVPNQGIGVSPGENIKKTTVSGVHVEPDVFEGLSGRILLISIFLKAARALVENQILFNKTHSAAQKAGSETKTDQTKKALTKEAKMIQEAKENKATCDIMIDVLMIYVCVLGAVLSAGILAPVLLGLAGAVLVAKLAIDIRKKELIDEGDYEGAEELDDAAMALEITATVLSSVAGGAAFAKSVASIAAKSAARAAARGVAEATKKASTAALEAAAASGKTVTKKTVETVTKRAAEAAVKEAAKDLATKATVRIAAEKGAQAGLKEALKTGIFKAADNTAVVAKGAIGKTVKETAPEVVKAAVKNYKKIIIQAVRQSMKKTTGLMNAGVSGVNALSLFNYKTEMAEAELVSDQLEVMLMLINKIIAELGKLKEGGNKNTKSLVDAIISSIKSFGGNFKLATSTLASLATAMSPGGK